MKTIALILLTALASCGAPRTVDVDLVGPAILDVVEIHDSYVIADDTLTDVQRNSYLTTSALLVEVINAAEAEK